MEVKTWIHSAKQVKIIEGPENSRKYIQIYTEDSKSDSGLGSVIAIFSDNNLRATLKYSLNGRCFINQPEQMAFLKALEYIQFSKADEKTVPEYTDSRITLQMLQNQKKHTHIIEQVWTKVIEMEQQERIAEFSWIKAHAGHCHTNYTHVQYPLRHNTHTHTDTHKHSHTNYTHTHTQANTETQTHIHTHPRICKHTYTQPHSHSHPTNSSSS
jgi:ribonuclease HI